ncbi:MAG TPA: YtxH domain-containing protein [Atopostipes sp.]|nr:YtxH domain-containing protein [Atopostipes sp.]
MRKNNWPLVILVGLFSAGLALLFAPKSGKELRNDIQNKANQTKDNVKTSADNLKQDFKDSYFEAEKEVELELAHLDQRQRELRETISSIEEELNH